MQIVIDIPDTLFTKIQNGKADKRTLETVILHGTPLPKGHGRLIDADVLVSEIKDLKKSPWYKDNTNFAYLPRKEALEIMKEVVIDNAPTIIEAESEV